MRVDLAPSVYKIFAEVMLVTGKDIKLVEKIDLQTDASVKVARQNMANHIMFYRPKHTETINHLIAHECGHILRIYKVETGKRLVPFTNDQLKLKALKEIEPEIQKLSRTLSFERLVKIANLWYNGTIKQLTNFPSDIMIEKWIYDVYPDLRIYQSKYLKKQYDEAIQALSGQVEKMTPRKILNASNSMNFAFYHILGTHFNDNNYLLKYDRSVYADIGNKLILLQQKSENSYKGDIDTVKNWADILELSNWYSWKDFEDVPANYLNTFE